MQEESLFNIPVLQLGDKVIQAHEVPLLLRRYQAMSHLIRGMVIDQAIAPFSCTEEERQAAIAEFEKQHIPSSTTRAAWLQQQEMTLAEMEELAIRPVKLEKFKTAIWGQKVESYFLIRKATLDQVVYSLIRTQEMDLARELYFRIQAGEQSFAELARRYSEGAEASTGGVLGPVPLSQPHPAIANLLRISRPRQLWFPRRVTDWAVIVRLEERIRVKLDDAMRHQLLDELFENWVQTQIKQAELGPVLAALAA